EVFFSKKVSQQAGFGRVIPSRLPPPTSVKSAVSTCSRRWYRLMVSRRTWDGYFKKTRIRNVANAQFAGPYCIRQHESRKTNHSIAQPLRSQTSRAAFVRDGLRAGPS